MWLPLELPMTMLHERKKNVLLIGFSEIGEDVDSLACGGPFNSHLMLPDTTRTART